MICTWVIRDLCVSVVDDLKQTQPQRHREHGSCKELVISFV